MTKRLIYTVFLLSLSLAACSENRSAKANAETEIAAEAAAQSGGVIFMEAPMKDILARAASEGKPIFLDLYATWCGPCKMMSEQEFVKPVAGDYFNATFVNAKFDAEKGEGLQLARKYGLRAYPTFLILDAKGKEIGRIVGAGEAEAFIQKVKEELAKAN